jgi:tyrosyl-tRNA synthetase
MTEGDGVSFAEFAYPIMQGWDWWMLYQRLHVQMQIGGSDQYGNIVTGVEVVKHARGNEPDPQKRMPDGELDNPVGFTVPLLTDSSGAKFGKSAGNAVWLDEYLTSTFDLYGYFVRRPDADVESLLKLFTFMPMTAIRQTMEEQMEDPSKRVAQHRLAYEVLALVHGEAVAKKTQDEHRMRYSKGGLAVPLVAETTAPGDEYLAPEGPTTPNNAPRIDMILPESLIMGKSIGRILFATGLATSVSDGHRLAVQKAAYIGGAPGRRPGHGESMNPSELTWNPIVLWDPKETQRYLIGGKMLILRKGKHNMRIVQVVSDEEYKASGQHYPGQPGTGRLRALREHMRALKAGNTTPQMVRDALRKEAEADEVLASSNTLKFPEKKSDEQTKLEAQLEDLLKDVEAKKEEEGEEEDLPRRNRKEW